MREMIEDRPPCHPCRCGRLVRGLWRDHHGRGNAVEAGGLAYDGTVPGGLLGEGFRARGGLPVINIAGCPIHPGWFVDTLMQIAGGTMAGADLDEWERPLAYTASLVHHGCARNEFYEFASAEDLGDLGCHDGKPGLQGHPGPRRLQHARVEWLGLVPDGWLSVHRLHRPRLRGTRPRLCGHPKISGIPIGLPTDMPKAWFVALASLSKAATPRRLKENAARPIPAVLPRDRRKREMSDTPA
jgi:hypothetical protein